MSYSNSELAPFAATDQFNKWRRLMRTVFMKEHKITSATARRLCELLDALEEKRIAYTKGERIFETKRVSYEELSEMIGLSIRRVIELMKLLEKHEYISVMRKKFSITKNYRNRYILKGFRAWLSTFTQVIVEKLHTITDSDLQSLVTSKKSKASFPCKGKPDKFWEVIAYEVQNHGEEMPCLVKVADKFRRNLIKNRVPRNIYNIIKRWKNFVQKAIELHKMDKASK